MNQTFQFIRRHRSYNKHFFGFISSIIPVQILRLSLGSAVSGSALLLELLDLSLESLDLLKGLVLLLGGSGNSLLLLTLDGLDLLESIAEGRLCCLGLLLGCGLLLLQSSSLLLSGLLLGLQGFNLLGSLLSLGELLLKLLKLVLKRLCLVGGLLLLGFDGGLGVLKLLLQFSLRVLGLLCVSLKSGNLGLGLLSLSSLSLKALNLGLSFLDLGLQLGLSVLSLLGISFKGGNLSLGLLSLSLE